MTARSTLAQAATKLANISNETLQEAADRWLRKEDLTGVTSKSLVSAMENEFQIDLSEKRALFKRVLEEFTLENMKTEGDMETNDGEDEDEKGMEDSNNDEEETGMFANGSSKRKGSSSSQSPTKKGGGSNSGSGCGGGSSNSGSGGGGGFKAEMQLSDELTASFGVSHLPSTEVTKVETGSVEIKPSTAVCSRVNYNSGKTDDEVEGKCPICYDSKELHEKFKCSHLVCSDCFKYHLKSEGIKVVVCSLCRSSVNESCLNDEETCILSERKDKAKYDGFNQILSSMLVNMNGIDGTSGNGHTVVPSYIIEEVFRQRQVTRTEDSRNENEIVFLQQFTADRN